MSKLPNKRPRPAAPTKTPLTECAKQVGEGMIGNLNRASFESAARHGLPGGRDRPYENLYLHRVAKPATLEVIKGLDLRSQSIADRWAQVSPDQVRKLEADGLLLQRVGLQADVEVEAIARGRMAGQNLDVPDSEVLELEGIDPDLHLYP